VIPSLAPILAGALEPYAGTLVLADDPRPGIPGPALTDPAILDALLDEAAEHIGAGDRRAQISLLCIEYVHVLMPLAVVASLLLGRTLPLRLEDISVILDDEHMPAAIRLHNDGAPWTEGDVFARFHDMIRGNLEPLIEAWAAYSGISPRVLWTNAANLYEAILRGMEKMPGAPGELIAAADALTTSTHWPDGWRNPFARPVFYRPEHPETQRWRRVCCVRYLIPIYDYCSNCPHLLAEQENARGAGGRLRRG
jgi:ferric iron reductase protein FhuF